MVQVALTEAGHGVAAQLPALLADAQAQLLQGFDEAEQAALRGDLARLQANLQAPAEP